MQCIYGILNKITGQYYIGSAINFSKRKNLHLKSLKSNKHHSYLLQKDWNPELFTFLILEKVELKENLISREQWWIDNTKSYYNICKIANSSLGVKRNEQTKEKIRQANLGLKHPQWRNEIKSKAQGGENHWTKRKKFSEESKLKMSNSQKSLYQNGYISPLKNKIVSKITKQKQRQSKIKAVEKYDLDNNLLTTYEAVTDVIKDGYLAKYVIQCCKNKKLTYKNFIWKYKEKFV